MTWFDCVSGKTILPEHFWYRFRNSHNPSTCQFLELSFSGWRGIRIPNIALEASILAIRIVDAFAVPISASVSEVPLLLTHYY